MPMPNFCRLAVAREVVARDQRLGELAARALAEQRVFGAQLHAAGEAILRRAVLADAHVAGGDAHDLAVLPIEHFVRRKARIDLDAHRLRLAGEPAAHIAERHDEVAVIAHQRRQHEVRQPQGAGGPEHVEAVVGDRRLDRRVFFVAPFRAAARRGPKDRSPRRRGCGRRPRSPSPPPPRRCRAISA